MIEFRFENKKVTLLWKEWYELAKIYYEYHRNSEIFKKFKTKNGYEYDEEGYKLGIWISTQRTNQNKLSQNQKENLEMIEFRFENKRINLSWDDWYELAKIYYEYHGNSEIPQKFKTKNGYEYDEEGYNLGIWISTQRIRQNKLSQNQKEKLEIIEFRFENKKVTLSWDDWYELAKIYYEYHRNSEIFKKFKTKNGYEYDEEGYNLGWWITNQRARKTKLSQNQKEKLEMIEFRFEKMKIKRLKK